MNIDKNDYSENDVETDICDAGKGGRTGSEPITRARPQRNKSRGVSEIDILDRFDAMVGPLPTDVRKALYFHISAAISEELMESGCAFLPTLGWLTINTIPKDDGGVFVRPSFKASRDLKDEIKANIQAQQNPDELRDKDDSDG